MFSEEFSIGEISKQTGLAPSAIRYYESRGLISPNRSSGNQRRYGPEAVTSLKILSFAQSAGFTLDEISDLHSATESESAPFAEWRELAERKLEELDEVIRRAEEMKTRLRHALSCQCRSIEECPLLEIGAPEAKRCPQAQNETKSRPPISNEPRSRP